MKQKKSAGERKPLVTCLTQLRFLNVSVIVVRPRVLELNPAFRGPILFVSVVSDLTSQKNRLTNNSEKNGRANPFQNQVSGKTSPTVKLLLYKTV